MEIDLQTLFYSLGVVFLLAGIILAIRYKETYGTLKWWKVNKTNKN